MNGQLHLPWRIAPGTLQLAAIGLGTADTEGVLHIEGIARCTA